MKKKIVTVILICFVLLLTSCEMIMVFFVGDNSNTINPPSWIINAWEGTDDSTIGFTENNLILTMDGITTNYRSLIQENPSATFTDNSTDTTYETIYTNSLHVTTFNFEKTGTSSINFIMKLDDGIHGEIISNICFNKNID